MGFPRHLNSAWHTVGVQNYLFSDWTCWVGRKTHRCPLRVGGGGHRRGGPGSSVQASRSVVSDSLRPRGRQRARPPCPSPTPRPYSNSCPRVGDAIQPSHPLVPFSSRLQSTAPGRGTSKAKKRKGKQTACVDLVTVNLTGCLTGREGCVRGRPFDFASSASDDAPRPHPGGRAALRVGGSRGRQAVSAAPNPRGRRAASPRAHGPTE